MKITNYKNLKTNKLNYNAGCEKVYSDRNSCLTAKSRGSPKSDGKKELWKDINARDCLTKYESMDPGGQGLGLREVTGKELQLLKVMNNGK